MRVFVAGASGVIGRRLVPQLIERGHEVVATTRSLAKGDNLRTLGASVSVMDGLDAASVGEVVARAEPDVVVHQMTALTGAGDPRRFEEEFAITNELRTRGTDNLLNAAEAVGVRRFVAQSYTGWPNDRGAGSGLASEGDGLDPSPPAAQRSSIAAIVHLEQAVTSSRLEGLVLRYGSLYGPGTAMANEFAELIGKRKLPIVGGGSGVWSFLHVDDAATATLAAIEAGAPGTYNVVDDEPAPVSEWLPSLAACLGAPAPRRVPAWIARFAIGEVGVSMMTQIRGSSNAKAKRELGWTPVWPSWRDGFRYGFLDETALRAAA